MALDPALAQAIAAGPEAYAAYRAVNPVVSSPPPEPTPVVSTVPSYSGGYSPSYYQQSGAAIQAAYQTYQPPSPIPVQQAVSITPPTVVPAPTPPPPAHVAAPVYDYELDISGTPGVGTTGRVSPTKSVTPVTPTVSYTPSPAEEQARQRAIASQRAMEQAKQLAAQERERIASIPKIVEVPKPIAPTFKEPVITTVPGRMTEADWLRMAEATEEIYRVAPQLAEAQEEAKATFGDKWLETPIQVEIEGKRYDIGAMPGQYEQPTVSISSPTSMLGGQLPIPSQVVESKISDRQFIVGAPPTATTIEAMAYVAPQQSPKSIWGGTLTEEDFRAVGIEPSDITFSEGMEVVRPAEKKIGYELDVKEIVGVEPTPEIKPFDWGVEITQEDLEKAGITEPITFAEEVPSDFIEESELTGLSVPEVMERHTLFQEIDVAPGTVISQQDIDDRTGAMIAGGKEPTEISFLPTKIYSDEELETELNAYIEAGPRDKFQEDRVLELETEREKREKGFYELPEESQTDEQWQFFKYVEAKQEHEKIGPQINEAVKDAISFLDELNSKDIDEVPDEFKEYYGKNISEVGYSTVIDGKTYNIGDVIFPDATMDNYKDVADWMQTQGLHVEHIPAPEGLVGPYNKDTLNEIYDALRGTGPDVEGGPSLPAYAKVTTTNAEGELIDVAVALPWNTTVEEAKEEIRNYVDIDKPTYDSPESLATAISDSILEQVITEGKLDEGATKLDYANSIFNKMLADQMSTVRSDAATTFDELISFYKTDDSQLVVGPEGDILKASWLVGESQEVLDTYRVTTDPEDIALYEAWENEWLGNNLIPTAEGFVDKATFANNEASKVSGTVKYGEYPGWEFQAGIKLAEGEILDPKTGGIVQEADMFANLPNMAEEDLRMMFAAGGTPALLEFTDSMGEAMETINTERAFRINELEKVRTMNLPEGVDVEDPDTGIVNKVYSYDYNYVKIDDDGNVVYDDNGNPMYDLQRAVNDGVLTKDQLKEYGTFPAAQVNRLTSRAEHLVQDLDFVTTMDEDLASRADEIHFWANASMGHVCGSEDLDLHNRYADLEKEVGYKWSPGLVDKALAVKSEILFGGGWDTDEKEGALTWYDRNWKADEFESYMEAVNAINRGDKGAIGAIHSKGGFGLTDDPDVVAKVQLMFQLIDEGVKVQPKHLDFDVWFENEVKNAPSDLDIMLGDQGLGYVQQELGEFTSDAANRWLEMANHPDYKVLPDWVPFNESIDKVVPYFVAGSINAVGMIPQVGLQISEYVVSQGYGAERLIASMASWDSGHLEESADAFRHSGDVVGHAVDGMVMWVAGGGELGSGMEEDIFTRTWKGGTSQLAYELPMLIIVGKGVKDSVVQLPKLVNQAKYWKATRGINKDIANTNKELVKLTDEVNKLKENQTALEQNRVFDGFEKVTEDVWVEAGRGGGKIMETVTRDRPKFRYDPTEATKIADQIAKKEQSLAELQKNSNSLNTSLQEINQQFLDAKIRKAAEQAARDKLKKEHGPIKGSTMKIPEEMLKGYETDFTFNLLRSGETVSAGLESTAKFLDEAYAQGLLREVGKDPMTGAREYVINQGKWEGTRVTTEFIDALKRSTDANTKLTELLKTERSVRDAAIREKYPDARAGEGFEIKVTSDPVTQSPKVIIRDLSTGIDYFGRKQILDAFGNKDIANQWSKYQQSVNTAHKFQQAGPGASYTLAKHSLSSALNKGMRTKGATTGKPIVKQGTTIDIEITQSGKARVIIEEPVGGGITRAYKTLAEVRKRFGKNSEIAKEYAKYQKEVNRYYSRKHGLTTDELSKAELEATVAEADAFVKHHSKAPTGQRVTSGALEGMEGVIKGGDAPGMGGLAGEMKTLWKAGEPAQQRMILEAPGQEFVLQKVGIFRQKTRTVPRYQGELHKRAYQKWNQETGKWETIVEEVPPEGYTPWQPWKKAPTAEGQFKPSIRGHEIKGLGEILPRKTTYKVPGFDTPAPGFAAPRGMYPKFWTQTVGGKIPGIRRTTWRDVTAREQVMKEYGWEPGQYTQAGELMGFTEGGGFLREVYSPYGPAKVQPWARFQRPLAYTGETVTGSYLPAIPKAITSRAPRLAKAEKWLREEFAPRESTKLTWKPPVKVQKPVYDVRPLWGTKVRAPIAEGRLQLPIEKLKSRTVTLTSEPISYAEWGELFNMKNLSKEQWIDLQRKYGVIRFEPELGKSLFEHVAESGEITRATFDANTGRWRMEIVDRGGKVIRELEALDQLPEYMRRNIETSRVRAQEQGVNSLGEGAKHIAEYDPATGKYNISEPVKGEIPDWVKNQQVEGGAHLTQAEYLQLARNRTAVKYKSAEELAYEQAQGISEPILSSETIMLKEIARKLDLGEQLTPNEAGLAKLRPEELAREQNILKLERQAESAFKDADTIEKYDGYLEIIKELEHLELTRKRGANIREKTPDLIDEAFRQNDTQSALKWKEVETWADQLERQGYIAEDFVDLSLVEVETIIREGTHKAPTPAPELTPVEMTNMVNRFKKLDANDPTVSGDFGKREWHYIGKDTNPQNVRWANSMKSETFEIGVDQMGNLYYKKVKGGDYSKAVERVETEILETAADTKPTPKAYQDPIPEGHYLQTTKLSELRTNYKYDAISDTWTWDPASAKIWDKLREVGKKDGTHLREGELLDITVADAIEIMEGRLTPIQWRTKIAAEVVEGPKRPLPSEKPTGAKTKFEEKAAQLELEAKTKGETPSVTQSNLSKLGNELLIEEVANAKSNLIGLNGKTGKGFTTAEIKAGMGNEVTIVDIKVIKRAHSGSSRIEVKWSDGSTEIIHAGRQKGGNYIPVDLAIKTKSSIYKAGKPPAIVDIPDTTLHKYVLDWKKEIGPGKWDPASEQFGSLTRDGVVEFRNRGLSELEMKKLWTEDANQILRGEKTVEQWRAEQALIEEQGYKWTEMRPGEKPPETGYRIRYDAEGNKITEKLVYLEDTVVMRDINALANKISKGETSFSISELNFYKQHQYPVKLKMMDLVTDATVRENLLKGIEETWVREAKPPTRPTEAQLRAYERHVKTGELTAEEALRIEEAYKESLVELEKVVETERVRLKQIEEGNEIWMENAKADFQARYPDLEYTASDVFFEVAGRGRGKVVSDLSPIDRYIYNTIKNEKFPSEPKPSIKVTKNEVAKYTNEWGLTKYEAEVFSKANEWLKTRDLTPQESAALTRGLKKLNDYKSEQLKGVEKPIEVVKELTPEQIKAQQSAKLKEWDLEMERLGIETVEKPVIEPEVVKPKVEPEVVKPKVESKVEEPVKVERVSDEVKVGDITPEGEVAIVERVGNTEYRVIKGEVDGGVLEIRDLNTGTIRTSKYDVYSEVVDAFNQVKTPPKKGVRQKIWDLIKGEETGEFVIEGGPIQKAVEAGVEKIRERGSKPKEAIDEAIRVLDETKKDKTVEELLREIEREKAGGAGPVAEAIREQREVIIKDIAEDVTIEDIIGERPMVEPTKPVSKVIEGERVYKGDITPEIIREITPKRPSLAPPGYVPGYVAGLGIGGGFFEPTETFGGAPFGPVYRQIFTDAGVPAPVRRVIGLPEREMPPEITQPGFGIVGPEIKMDYQFEAVPIKKIPVFGERITEDPEWEYAGEYPEYEQDPFPIIDPEPIIEPQPEEEVIEEVPTKVGEDPIIPPPPPTVPVREPVGETIPTPILPPFMGPSGLQRGFGWGRKGRPSTTEDLMAGRAATIFLPGVEVGDIFGSPLLKKEDIAVTKAVKYRAPGSRVGKSKRVPKGIKTVKV